MDRKAFEHVMSNVRLRREHRKMKALAARTGLIMGGVAVVAAFSGCHLTVGTPGAIREHHRGMAALITEGKTSPDKESAYWQTQKMYDVEETRREYAPGLLQRWGILPTAKQPEQEAPNGRY